MKKCDDMMKRKHLQIQSLRLTLILSLKDTLTSSSEILHLHSHTTLAEGHEAGLGADGLDIGAGKVVLLADEFFEVDVFAEGHFAGVEEEDLALGVFYKAY